MRYLTCLLLLSCNLTEAPAPLCAWEDGAYARVLDADGPFFTGPDALAAPGDLLLANPTSAFVIQSVDHPRTYYYYGGTPIDVVPMRGCTQAQPERFGELGFLPGRLDLLDFEMSVLHLLRGETATIVNDGSDGGPAHVRIDAVDDRFWLVEDSLLRAVVERGDRKEPGGPLGADFTVDYILPPDRPVLEIRVTATNPTSSELPLLVGVALFPSDERTTQFYSDGTFSFGGFGLDTRVPWWTSVGSDGSYALAWDSDGVGRTNVSGVEALLDLNQAVTDPWILAPAGQPGDTRVATMYLSVGETDASSAITALHASLPTFLEQDYTPVAVGGAVTSATDGAALANARVIVEGKDQYGSWIWLTEMRTHTDGRFAGTWPEVAGAERRLRVVAEGRPEPAPIALDGPAEDLAITVDPGGVLHVSATDGTLGMPARVSIYQSGSRRSVHFAPPSGELDIPLAPGAYDVSITRGFGWEPVQATVTVEAGAVQQLDAALLVGPDTRGWLSFDGHVHASPSADSDTPMLDRFATAASEGLSVAIHTDHEIITDPRPLLASSAWRGHVASMLGEEFTATIPEHLNMYGLSVGPEDGPRGNPPVWFGKDLPTLYGDMAARGAGIRTLNHPKNGCAWMCLIGWDTVNAMPTVTDPTQFGLQPDAQLWSWDFEAIELLNGAKYMFVDPANPRDTGLFDDWANFWHHGHRITAVGVSDVHGLDGIGTPRTYFAAPSEDLLAFEDAWVIDAVKGGHTMIGAGAFARATVAGAGPGDTVTAAGGAAELLLRVEGIPAIDVSYATVFANCDAVAKVDATAPGGVVKLDTSVGLTLSQDTAIVVAAFGEAAYPRGLEPMPAWTPRLLTNPILIDVDGNGVWDPPGGKTCNYAGFVPAPP